MAKSDALDELKSQAENVPGQDMRAKSDVPPSLSKAPCRLIYELGWRKKCGGGGVWPRKQGLMGAKAATRVQALVSPDIQG